MTLPKSISRHINKEARKLRRKGIPREAALLQAVGIVDERLRRERFVDWRGERRRA